METFREVFLQTDLNTLSATLKLIDLLSQGVCLLEPQQRMYIEAFHFIREKSGFNTGELYPLNHMVWTRASFAIGQPTPMLPDLREDLEAMDQIKFFDYMWNLPLSDMIDELRDKATKWNPVMPDMSLQMNEDKAANASDYCSFYELFLIELRGIIDCHIPAFSKFCSRSMRETMESI